MVMTKFVVEGNDLDGAAVTRNIPVLVGGVDANGNVQTLGISSTGGSTTQGPDADGAPVTGNPVLIGGVDVNGNVQRVFVDTSGNLGVITSSTKPSTATLTNVASNAGSVTLLSANANRLGGSIYNDSTQIVYVKLGTTASTSSYTVQVGPNGFYEFPNPCYTGRVDGIWASANGNARITELT